MNEHAQVPGELRVRGSGRRELVATGNTISIGDQVFPLGDVDRVAYRAATRINQASYGIALARGDTSCRFLFDAYRRGTDLEDKRAIWNRLVELIEATAVPRITAAAVRTIGAGQTVRLGSPAIDAVDLDAEGIRRHRPFAAKLPWDRVARADLYQGLARVWTMVDGTVATTPKIGIPIFGWNAVVLPDVVARLARR
jgi:hypothetical protein